jgi:hypothetical protein
LDSALYFFHSAGANMPSRSLRKLDGHEDVPLAAESRIIGRGSFSATEPFFEIEAYGRRLTTNAYSAGSAVENYAWNHYHYGSK